MPSRAKLTTRGISATTVTTETLPKNLPLTNNELDSNFINLRDQTFAIVGDDSTGIDIRAGDTIKFTGSGGATVTASGDTITITAGGGGGGSAQGITFVGDDSTGTRISDGETIKIAGGLGIDTAMSGDVLTITATNTLGTLQANGNVLSPISTNDDLQLQANGTGEILLSSNVIEIGNQNTDVLFSTNGQMAMTIRAGENTEYDKASYIILDQTAQPPGGASNITISPQLEGLIVMGNGTNNATVTSNGAKNLTLNTNSGTNSGSILINQGSNANIEIAPNGTGKVKLDNNYWPNTDGTAGQTLITNGSGVLSWSNTAQGITFVGDDSTGTRISDNETIKIAGGTGITTAMNDDVLTITATNTVSTGDLTITGTTISAGVTNADITISSTGTGNLNVDMDTVRIGDSNSNATITTNGTGDLILNTNSGNNTGSITIADGSGADIIIQPDGSGKIKLDNNYWPNTDGTSGQTIITDGSGNLSWANASTQGITFVGDDSTGTLISDGETVKFAGGAGTTVSVSGDTVTITAVATGGTLGDLSVSGTTISSVTTNSNIILDPNGTGKVVISDSLATGYITSNGTQALILQTNSGVNSGSININYGTGGGGGPGSAGNGNIEISTTGTGQTHILASTTQVGRSNTDATITTNGTGDIIINTNSGTNSGVIKIADGSAGKISIIPNTTGRVDLGHEAETTTNFPTAIGSLGGYEVTDNRVRGTGRFYSNLTYAPYTATTDQVVPHNDYAMFKTNGGSFDSANIRNVASAHQMVFDLNGGSATATTTNSSSTGVGAQVNLNYYMNTAGGTKTGLNAVTSRNLTQIVAGHGGALTIPRTAGVVNDLLVGRNTGDTTTLTEAWAFRDQGITYSGTGTTGTNSVVTDYTAFETGVNAPSSTNTPWAFRVRTSSQNWRSRIGAVDLPRRWPIVATHSSGAAYTVDFQTVGHGFHLITLTSNITSFTMSNFPTSTVMVCEFDLVFIQDGTGGRTISFTPTSTEVFKFRNGTNTLADSTAAPEILHAKVFTRYDGTKTIFYWDIDNREYV